MSEVRWARWSPQKKSVCQSIVLFVLFLVVSFCFFCGVLWFCLVAVLALVFISVDLCVDGCIVCFVFFAFASCFFLLGCCAGFFVDVPACDCLCCVLVAVFVSWCWIVLICCAGKKDGKSDGSL